MSHGRRIARYDAVLFDLLSGLLDSWSLWAAVAGDETLGRRWRNAARDLTCAAEGYVSYEELVETAAVQCGLGPEAPRDLLARWDELRPWEGVNDTLRALRAHARLAVVTNCSEALARRAVACLDAHFDPIVSAERAGAYKPHPRPYRLALEELGCAPARCLFVAGSAVDVAGAAAAGMPVFWHNPHGLPTPADAPAPIATARSLRELVPVVAG